MLDRRLAARFSLIFQPGVMIRTEYLPHMNCIIFLVNSPQLPDLG